MSDNGSPSEYEKFQRSSSNSSSNSNRRSGQGSDPDTSTRDRTTNSLDYSKDQTDDKRSGSMGRGQNEDGYRVSNEFEIEYHLFFSLYRVN